MHAIFQRAQQGINTIIVFMVLIGVLSISARLFVQYALKDSNKSKQAKKAYADFAAAVVAGTLGIIMLKVLSNQR